MEKILNKKSKLILIPVVLLVAVVIFYFKGLFIAAVVNGKPISRLSVIHQLEKEGGKQVLDNLVVNNLILQEANKEKVTVTSTEVSGQVNKITENLKTSGQSLDTALSSQGMTKKDLEDQVKLQILVQKMASKDISVADKDAQDYFDKNKSSYPKGTKFESVKDQIKSDLQQQKMNQAIQSWIANLKSKAKINYFVSY